MDDAVFFWLICRLVGAPPFDQTCRVHFLFSDVAFGEQKNGKDDSNTTVLGRQTDAPEAMPSTSIYVLPLFYRGQSDEQLKKDRQGQKNKLYPFTERIDRCTTEKTCHRSKLTSKLIWSSHKRIDQCTTDRTVFSVDVIQNRQNLTNSIFETAVQAQ